MIIAVFYAQVCLLYPSSWPLSYTALRVISLEVLVWCSGVGSTSGAFTDLLIIKNVVLQTLLGDFVTVAAFIRSLCQTSSAYVWKDLLFFLLLLPSDWLDYLVYFN